MDGKAKNAVTDTRSTLRCFLCGATPINFNDIDNLTTKFTTKEENLAYGRVCDLHACLRSFDAINTLSDKLPVKQWRVQKQEDKDKVATRKKNQQAKFESELNLVVDVPMQGGVGNSNTGNTARKAFQDEEAFSCITKVDQNLIHRIHVMLIAINTDHCLNSEALRAYGFKTAKLWVDLYGWCNMSVFMHQLFFHAWQSILHSSLPLSFFSE